MYFIFILALIVIGSIAAITFVENKIPQSKKALDFVKPYSEWVGLVSLVLGFYWLVKTLWYLGIYLKVAFVLTIIKLTSCVLLIILGFLLAQPLIMQLVGKNKNITDATDKMNAKFIPLKEKLGLAAIAFGLVNLLLFLTRF